MAFSNLMAFWIQALPHLIPHLEEVREVLRSGTPEELEQLRGSVQERAADIVFHVEADTGRLLAELMDR